ncbi:MULTISPECIES: ATP-binding protein [unclassified Streptomyces]|uniref:ATP-binding protein n=1 Tax=unclassified Streptomyces TaxID=2593676 RepID=UPI00278C5DE1|nr:MULTISPECIES: ATP-binding protein [unclassified Streptomyces]
MNQELVQLPTPTRHFGVQLSPTPRGARLARLLGTEQLRTWDLPPATIDLAAHVIAELATNAATHARLPGRDFRLDLHAAPTTLRIEVTDTRADRPPTPQPTTPDAESGRGLTLVEALTDRWGTAAGPAPRKTVWAEIDLPSPAPGNPYAGATADHPTKNDGEKRTQTKPLPTSRRDGHSVG